MRVSQRPHAEASTLSGRSSQQIAQLSTTSAVRTTATARAAASRASSTTAPCQHRRRRGPLRHNGCVVFAERCRKAHVQSCERNGELHLPQQLRVFQK
jgi:hypothetical protein